MTKLKKFGIVFLVFCLGVVLVYAAQKEADLTLSWEMPPADLINMGAGGGWDVLISDSQTGPFIPAVDMGDQSVFINYDGTTQGVFTATEELKITGTPGTTVKKYFTLRAVYNTGEKGMAASAAENMDEQGNGLGTYGADIIIPAVGIPFNIKIRIGIVANP